MTKFNKKDFFTEGDYLFYGKDRKFVARFKHRGGPFTKAKLVKALCKFYTTDEYFNRLAENEAPFKIIMNDGYVDFDMKEKKFIFNY